MTSLAHAKSSIAETMIKLVIVIGRNKRQLEKIPLGFFQIAVIVIPIFRFLPENKNCLVPQLHKIKNYNSSTSQNYQ
jgi:hypothetical protein